jgi:hypothetical protein
MRLIWRRDQYSISVDAPSQDDISTGAMTVWTSNRRPIQAAAVAALSKLQESESSENDTIGTC